MPIQSVLLEFVKLLQILETEISDNFSLTCSKVKQINFAVRDRQIRACDYHGDHTVLSYWKQLFKLTYKCRHFSLTEIILKLMLDF